MPVINPTPSGPVYPPNPTPDPDGPCVWPVDVTCCPGWPADPAAWTPQHILAVEIATDMLWRRTAGRYGLCPELVRPCRRACTPDHHGTGFLFDRSTFLLDPYQDDRGRWLNFGCGCATLDCSCKPQCTITLPGPVNAVVEVRLDGQIVPPDQYVLHRLPTAGELVRVGGPDGPCWPDCQDLEQPHTAPGTFSVLYLRGRAVPAAGMRALGTLACEIHKQCVGASGCRLPERVKTVTREGVSYDMFDPGEWLDDGLTGLPEVDAWLRSVNPHGLTQPSAVFSLDLAPAPRSTRYLPDGP